MALNTITLTRRDNAWQADYAQHPRGEQWRQVFGTSVQRLPLSSVATEKMVLAWMRQREPDAVLLIQ